MIWLFLACAASSDSATDAPEPQDSPSGEDSGGERVFVQGALPLLQDAPDLDEGEVLRFELRASAMTHTIEDWRDQSALTVEGYGYQGQQPGPLLRAQVGDRVEILFQNDLEVPSTVHWHGLDVPWEMDGVVWMGAPIEPGASFTYAFTVSQAGTFWYHPHFDTVHQVDLGLYGAFVVEDPADPLVDRDLVLVLDDWTGQQGDAGYADELHGAHGREGVWTVNGAVQPQLQVDAGEVLRLRLVNASNHGYVALSLDGARVIARDQGLLPAVEDLDVEVLGPGDRVELEVRPGQDVSLLDHPWSLNGGQAMGEAQSLLDLVVATPGEAAQAVSWPESGEAPSPDPGRTDIHWTFQGSIHADDWMINGERFPDVTIPELTLGDTAVVEVRNLSASEHPYHLHGMAFEVLSVNGVAPAHRRIEDTVNVPMHGVVRLLVHADNPGDWMSHCHILPHADGGMMTVLRVE